MKKKIFILVVFLFSLFVLVGCGKTVEGPQGEPGPAGKNGADGKSAYQLAKEHDPEIGSEEEWLESLQGNDGRNGLPGADGAKGDDGQDAREIELFAEDGGVYWRYVGSADSTLLYYFKDTITVTFAKRAYNSEEEVIADFLKDMQTALNAPAEYTYQKVAAALAAAQQAKDDADAALAAAQAAKEANAEKIAAYSTAGAAEWAASEKDDAAKQAYLTALATAFLTDVSTAKGAEITADNFYSTFNTKDDTQFLGASSDGTTAMGLCKDHPELLAKWSWLLEYIGELLAVEGKTSNSSHKYEFRALYINGLAVPAGASTSGKDYYCNRYFIGNLSNMLKMANDQVGGSSYPQLDFSSLDKYDCDAIYAAQTGDAPVINATAAAEAAAEALTAATEAEVAAKATRDAALITLKPDFSNAYDNLYKYLVNDSEKTMDQMVADKHASGILYNGAVTELGAKWTWLIGWLVESYMAAHDGSINDNKYVSTVYSLLNPLYEGRSDATGDYRDRLVMSALHNYIYYLRKDGVTDYDNPSGSGSDSYWKDFFPADPEAYRSLEEAAKQDVYTVIKEEEVARVGEDSWKHYELISMDDPLIDGLYDHDTQLVRGWIDVEDKALEAIPSNHSIVLFLHVVKKVIVDLEFNGGFTEDVLGKAVAAKMLADINTILGEGNEITAEQFYDTFKTNLGTWLKDQAEFLEKYANLINWICGKKNGNKRIRGILDDLGINQGYTSSSDPVLDEFSVQFLANFLYDFLTGTFTQKHGGSWADYPAPSFANAEDYAGIAQVEMSFEGITIPEVKLEGIIVDNGLPTVAKLGEIFACWVLKGDETNTPVAPEEMEDGETYVAYYGTLPGDEILDEFIQDINAIAGFADVTRANFLAKMSGDKFMGVTAMTDAREFTTAGLCKDNPEFLAKWAWLFEYVGEMLAKPEYSTTEEGPGTSSHKYSYAALEAFGLAYPKQSSLKTDATDFNKVNDYFVSNLANLLNHTNTPHGDNDWHPVVDFRPVANWNNGLVEAYNAAHAE